MGGFLGIGGSSASTDRANQLQSTTDLRNVFSYGLGTGQQQQSTGTGVLSGALQPIGEAQNYFSNLLNAGRTQVAQNSAPAVNAALSGADAQRTQNAQLGTGRSGGTAAANANAGAATTANVDNIINQNLVSGQQQGAQGLLQAGGAQAGVGAEFLQNAMQLLGLGTGATTSILNNATQSKQAQQQVDANTGAALGKLAIQLLGL